MADTFAQQVQNGDTEASIDSVNQWMRAQPWYQQQLASWGQDPSAVHLSKEQGRQIVKLAQANGVKVDEGHIEVDPGGNFNPIGHKLRNTLIVAGAVGAAIAAPYLYGALAGGGAGAGGAGGAGALEGGGTLAANLGGAGALSGAGAGTAAAVSTTFTTTSVCNCAATIGSFKSLSTGGGGGAWAFSG